MSRDTDKSSPYKVLKTFMNAYACFINVYSNELDTAMADHLMIPSPK